MICIGAPLANFKLVNRGLPTCTVCIVDFVLADHTSVLFMQVIRNYGLLTGTVAMPQYFGLGYHQCRWNYMSQDDILELNQDFDK